MQTTERKRKKLDATVCLSKYLTNQFYFTEIKGIPSRSKPKEPLKMGLRKQGKRDIFLFKSNVYIY